MTLYQPFLDHAIATLKEQIDLEPYPIPPGFERKEGVMGKGKRQEKVLTTSHAWQSNKLRQIRAAHVQGGNSLQVLNFVIFPQPNYDLPFFGADLVTLPGGHLIALDMQPLFRDDPNYQKKYTEPEVVQTRVLAAFKDYLQAYLNFVNQAELVSDPEELVTVLQAQKRYINYRAEKDPARGMFTRLYGSEWTEEYIHGFLFDLERKLAVTS